MKRSSDLASSTRKARRCSCGASRSGVTTAWSCSSATSRRPANASAFASRPRPNWRRPEEFFATNNRSADWTDVAYQELTLRVADSAGAPIEFCAHMPADPRREARFDLLRGGAPARLDHVQIHTADIRVASNFYLELGFRISEYASEDGTLSSPLRSVFLARKGNANDIVLASNEGPRLHHFAYVVHDASTTLLRVCDVAAAMGMRASVEWGPGRHGLGNERFLYLRDPDGHRIELLSHPYQLIDLEDESYGWSTDRHDIADTLGAGRAGFLAPSGQFLPRCPDSVTRISGIARAEYCRGGSKLGA